MKTIKQVADEVGITKQAVSKRIDNLGCRNELVLVGGQYQMSDEIAERIRGYSTTANQPPTNHQPTDKLAVGGDIMTVISNVLNVTEDVTEVTKAILELKTENVRLETQLTADRTAYEQRLADKDKQIEELRQLLGEQTRERQAYSAALITANTKLSEIRHLTLTDRLFGWGNVQAMLTDSSAADRNEKPTDIVDIDIKE